MGKTPKKILMMIIFIMLALVYQQCQNTGKEQTKNSPYVSIKGQSFIDPEGRDLTLHGINVVNKDPNTGYVGHITPEEMAIFKSWGFNAIRLGIIWDGLEPQPGEYNEEYLARIDEMIQWAANNDLYVFLDMHQDLYSVEFSDGALPGRPSPMRCLMRQVSFGAMRTSSVLPFKLPLIIFGTTLLHRTVLGSRTIM